MENFDGGGIFTFEGDPGVGTETEVSCSKSSISSTTSEETETFLVNILVVAAGAGAVIETTGVDAVDDKAGTSADEFEEIDFFFFFVVLVSVDLMLSTNDVVEVANVDKGSIRDC